MLGSFLKKIFTPELACNLFISFSCWLGSGFDGIVTFTPIQLTCIMLLDAWMSLVKTLVIDSLLEHLVLAAGVSGNGAIVALPARRLLVWQYLRGKLGFYLCQCCTLSTMVQNRCKLHQIPMMAPKACHLLGML